ncbi:MAG: DUF2079 domain-containing protein [Actinomycetota bacterium]|nr:DUF2079 domain-containing protein [Actinomycetota bacterium]
MIESTQVAAEPNVESAVSRFRAWMPYAVAVALAGLYATMSVNNHLMFRTTGYDLGIFEQAVRAYAEGRAPVSELRGPGFVLLGDHFHPILITLAPFYKVFPSTITLLVAQAVLVAVSAIPVTRLAARRFGTSFGLVVGLAYGLSWGLLSAVDFDFHEIVFAVPLLAFALERLALEQWTAAVWWSVPLVLVKEDLPLTVAAIGGYLMLKGRRRLGGSVVLFGMISFVLIVLVLIPAFSPDSTYGQAHNLGATAPSGLGDVVRLAWQAPGRLVLPEIKIETVVALLAPTAFLALFSPMMLLVVPTLLWRFLSVNPNYWGTEFHYSAVLMPIIYFAFLQAMATGESELRAEAFRRLRRVVVAVSVVAAAAGLVDVFHGRTWTASDRVVAAREMIALIPPGETVAASNRLAPQLTTTRTVQLFPAYQGNRITSDWVLVDTDFVYWPSTPAKQERELADLRASGYQTVREARKYVLLHRTG